MKGKQIEKGQNLTNLQIYPRTGEDMASDDQQHLIENSQKPSQFGQTATSYADDFEAS